VARRFRDGCVVCDSREWATGGIRLVGVVLNRQKAKEGGLYYGEYYSAAAPAGTD